MNNHWENQPRDENGRFAEKASAGYNAIRSAAHPGTSSFGHIDSALESTLGKVPGALDNPWVLNTAKIGLAVGTVAMATRTGQMGAAAHTVRSAVGGMGPRIGAHTHSSASRVYFKTPVISSAVLGTKANNIQVAGQAFGYRRKLDDSLRGAVKGSAAGKLNNNPYSRSFQFGKIPTQTFEWKPR